MNSNNIMIRKNAVIPLEITGASYAGKGIGRYENMVVFVNGAVKGDKVKAHILKVAKTHAFAKADEIIEPSADRIGVDCNVFDKCGGCVFRNISYEAELELKYQRLADAIKRIAKIDVVPDPVVGMKNTEGYRNKAQYPVGAGDGGVNMGFYAPHSHRIIDCRDCKLHPKIFGKVLEVIGDWIDEKIISVYDETSHTGLLRHVYVRYGEISGEIMVCLIINGRKLPHSDALINGLTQKISDIKSICLNFNTKRTNVILGEKTEVLYGSDHITDMLCGLKFRISPLSFYQVNRTGAETLYSLGAEYAGLSGNETLVDLYCGTGTIGLTMAGRVKRLIGVEIIPQAVEDAKYNAEMNGIKNAEFICGDASGAAKRFVENGLKPDVVIVDPPRKGCSQEVIDAISVMSPEKVVYISCDPETLARDIAVFYEKGYLAERITPVDMFPRTAHVETVVMLSPKKNDSVINVKVEFGEGEGKVPLDNIAKRAEAYKPKERVTYKMIKEYIEAKYGFKVHTAYIEEVKRDLGLPMYDATNAVEELKQPRKHPTPEKVEAIKDALKHFGMICVGGHDE